MSKEFSRGVDLHIKESSNLGRKMYESLSVNEYPHYEALLDLERIMVSLKNPLFVISKTPLD
jgi:hypothetical protein